MITRIALSLLTAFTLHAQQRVEVSRDLWISAYSKEVEGNNGGSHRLKLKGIQEFFLIDFDPVAHLGTSFGVLTGSGTIIVKLRISTAGAHHVLERNWHPTQRETNLPGGAVEVTFALSDLNDVTRWILGFGSDVEVIEPAELRATIAAEGTKMAQRNA